MIKEKNIKSPSELASGRILIDFYAPRCSHCRAMEPSLINFADEFADTEFIKVNTDENFEAAEAFGIRSLPTFALYENGREVKRVVGARPRELRELLALK